MTLLFPEESYAIRGAIFEVYKEKGSGFLEATYQECLEKELQLQNIPFSSQQELQMTYKGMSLHQTYKPDFIVYGKIILEIKAVTKILPQHEAQLINYLKATGLRLGFLVNFSAYPAATIKRFVL